MIHNDTELYRMILYKIIYFLKYLKLHYNSDMFQKLYQKLEIIYNNYNSKVYDEYYDVTNIILNVINKMLLCIYKELLFVHKQIYL